MTSSPATTIQDAGDVARLLQRPGVCWRCGVPFAQTTVAVLRRCAELAWQAGERVVTDTMGQALAYTSTGWRVFPSRPDASPCPQPDDCPCKRPLTLHGCRDATTDPDVIRGWWHRWPTANVAIATGDPGPDVLDVDVSAKGSGWPGFNRLKRAGLLAGAGALVRTPRGGLHAYYRGTGQPNGSLARAGHFIDFRGAGGYVLAPPSRVHGKPYTLLDLTRLAAWVAALDPDSRNRNNGLYWAARRAIESGLDPGDLAAAAVQAGLSETEARRTIDSARRARQ